MHQFSSSILTFLLSLFMTILGFGQINHPIAKKQDKILVKHNHARIDAYYWMNQLDSPDVLEYFAKLRIYKTNDNPLIFECNMDAGHGGGSGRTAERKEIARVFTFILDLEEIAQ
jgi:protease II